MTLKEKWYLATPRPTTQPTTFQFILQSNILNAKKSLFKFSVLLTFHFLVHNIWLLHILPLKYTAVPFFFTSRCILLYGPSSTHMQGMVWLIRTVWVLTTSLDQIRYFPSLLCDPHEQKGFVVPKPCLSRTTTAHTVTNETYDKES